VVARTVLAFGILFGVGATVTDAAWTDPEFAKGTFTAGTFNIESATDQALAAYGNHNTSGSAAVFTFDTASLPLSTAMYPGAVVASPWAIRAAAGSIRGTATLAAATLTSTSNSFATDLQYRVFWSMTNPNCTASSTSASNYLVGSATTWGSMTATPTTTALTLAAGASSTTPGAPVYLCFQFTLPTTAANGDQGLSASFTWAANGTT
jgi:predicted ribosomally synthesized peptide with SipW-like signal peptide